MAIQFPLIFGSPTRTPFPTLQQLNQQQSVLFGQLASGNRLTSAAIDPAGLAVAEQLTSQVNGLDQAQNNIGDALNLLNTAEGALGNQEATLQQQRTLAVQAGDAALNSNDLQAIQTQIQQLNQGLDQTGQQAQFNGMALLNGANQAFNFQIGANAGQSAAVSLPASNSEQLGTSTVDVTTADSQQSALWQIDQAIQATSANRSSVGASENGLQSAQNNAATDEENQASGRSLIADTNVAQASSNLSASLLLQQFSLFALQQQANAFALTTQLLAA